MTVFNLRFLERTTFRGALAIAFTDRVTGKPITDYLDVRAYLFNPANVRPLRTARLAEKSPTSKVYGFRTLPGLEDYQRGDAVAAGSVSYLVHVQDTRQRYLPQFLRYDLPFAQPAVQEVQLYSSPAYIPPAGYGIIRGSLRETTVPPNLENVGAARWAHIRITAPGLNPGDAEINYEGMSNDIGQFLVCTAYPTIAENVLLSEADWNITVAVGYQPASYQSELSEMQTMLPDFNGTVMPLQTSLEAQADARLISSVDVVDAENHLYTAVSVSDVPLTQTLAYNTVLTVQTAINATPNRLSDLLVVPN